MKWFHKLWGLGRKGCGKEYWQTRSIRPACNSWRIRKGEEECRWRDFSLLISCSREIISDEPPTHAYHRQQNRRFCSRRERFTTHIDSRRLIKIIGLIRPILTGRRPNSPDFLRNPFPHQSTRWNCIEWPKFWHTSFDGHHYIDYQTFCEISINVSFVANSERFQRKWGSVSYLRTELVHS